MLKCFCFVAAVLAFPLSYAAAATDPVLTAQIAGNRVTVSGVTPRGEVIFFGRSVVYQSGMPLLRRHSNVLTADPDGVVTWTLDEGVPRYSTFAVVDFESGASVIASPAGFTPPRIDLPAVVWRGGQSYIDLDRDAVEVLFVRPGQGAWMLGVIWQGGRFDADARNDAKLRAGLAGMKPLIGTKEAPPTATPRDVIVIIDPRQLDAFMRRAD